jgi:polysaccharide biosynthesis protein PslJ
MLWLCAAVAANTTVRLSAVAVVGIVLLVQAHERLLSPRATLALTFLTILFIPIKRYTLPASLPFNLELYRLVVAFVLVAWGTALLIDRRISVRKSGLEPPLILFAVAVALSLFANIPRVNSIGSDEIKTLTFFASFVLIFYVIVSVCRKATDIDFLVRLLAGGGAVLGLLAIVESATGNNPFNHLQVVFPFLHYDPSLAPDLVRGGHFRSYGSAQHPIAFGAALAVLLPFAVYRAKAFNHRIWWLATLLILMGILSSRSRTGIIMLLAIGVVYIILRPRDMKRLWPAILPTLLIIHFAMPGTLGGIKESFFPKGGIVAEQADTEVGSGRLATLGPALRNEFEPDPLFGEGFGTRITQPDAVVSVPNAPILDDEWLGMLLEIGIFGVFALIWLFVRSVRRMGKAARTDLSPRGWLLVATTSSIVGYGVGMFTYDAFSFIQSTFLFFITLGIGTACLLSPTVEWQRFAFSEHEAIAVRRSRRRSRQRRPRAASHP